MAVADVDIAASADDAYARLCDVRRLSEWVAGVADVAVLEADAAGRAVRVRFTGMPARGSVSYELRYAYDDAARTVTWSTDDRTLRDVRGEASLTDLGAGRCHLRYELHTWAAESLPVWARAVLQEESAEKVAFAFRRWLER